MNEALKAALLKKGTEKVIEFGAGTLKLMVNLQVMRRMEAQGHILFVYKEYMWRLGDPISDRADGLHEYVFAFIHKKLVTKTYWLYGVSGSLPLTRFMLLANS